MKPIKDPTTRRSAIGIDVLYVGHEDIKKNTLAIVIVQFFSRRVYAYPTQIVEPLWQMSKLNRTYNNSEDKNMSTKPGDIAYLDLRSWSYGSSWFDDLISQSLIVNFTWWKLSMRRLILSAPILRYMGKSYLFEVDEAYVRQFGLVKSYDPSVSFLVDKTLVDSYPGCLTWRCRPKPRDTNSVTSNKCINCI